MSDNLWPVVVGGLIGITGGIVGPACLNFVNRRADRISLSGAIVSEIAGLVDIVERRNYISGIDQLIKLVESNPGPPHIPAWFYFSVRRNPFAVYDANLSRIGNLHDPMPGQIVRFYTMASAVMEDIQDMKPAKELNYQRSREESIITLKHMHTLFVDTIALGKKIVKDAPKQRKWF